jgi:hypothetical protein
MGERDPGQLTARLIRQIVAKIRFVSCESTTKQVIDRQTNVLREHLELQYCN